MTFNLLEPVLIFLITAGVKEFFDKVLGKPLDSVPSAAIAVFVTAVIAFGNTLVNGLPSNALGVLTAVVSLIAAVAAAFGVHATVKFFQPGKK